MDGPSTRATTPDRNRYLNIVYFVESARSHTIRINLRHAKFFVAGALLVATWALGSIAWIGILKYDLGRTRDRLESALSAVFEFQIKNEHVFDLAYPNDSTNSYYSEAAQLASNNPIAEPQPKLETVSAPTAAQAPSNSPASTLNDKKSATTNAAPNTTTSKNTAAPAVAATPPDSDKQKSPDSATLKQSVETASPSTQQAAQLIAISAVKLSKTGSKISLNFAITNSNPQKAEGYIWAIATVTGSDGKSTSIIAPEHAKLLKDSDSIASYKSGYRFSIQRFKDKSFDFKVPSAVHEWKLTKLTVLFTDVAGTSTEQVNLPVDSLAINHRGNFPITSLKF